MPWITSKRWFSFLSSWILKRLPQAPDFGSEAPKTSRSILDHISAPAHITHGSKLTYKVAPCRYLDPFDSKAADKGHAQALYNLANMYYSGTGTTKDYKTAYKLFLKSKIKGVEESQYYIEKISGDITPEELSFLNKEFESLIEKKIDLPIPIVVEN